MIDKYNSSYYKNNNQDLDRIGNLFYKNIIKNNFEFKTYLDFGCGVGYLLKKIEKIKGLNKIYGFEINDFAIKKSKENTRISEIHNNLDNIDNKLDLISMLHVIEHINDSQLSFLLKKIRTKLKKKNGRIIISTPAKNGLAHKIKKKNWIGFKDPTHINLKNYEDWIRYFTREKFEVIASFSDGLWDFPYGQYMNMFKYIKIYFYMFFQIFFGKIFLNYNEGETFIFTLKDND